MPVTHRRGFLRAAGFALAGIAGLPTSVLAQLRKKTKITEIEVHEIVAPFQDYNAEALFRYHGFGIQTRKIYIVKTEGGLEGYGDGGPGPDDQRYRDRYVGTDVFDWIADPMHLAMNMACYDLMGKYLGVPAWKLIGQQARSWVPVAAWTVSRPPEKMAEEVLNVSRRGYRWLKYHVDVLQSAIDQTEAMQKVAPPGFKVHYDFNEDSNFEAVYPVLKELEKFPIAARIEDPIKNEDHEGYRLLRQKLSIPVLIHHGPHGVFAREGLCDGFMSGHAPIGLAMREAVIAESTNIPFMLQQGGGPINQAFLAHEASVFKMATLDHVNLCHLWKEDVIKETMEVVGGSIEVPKGPGLGVTVDRDKLERIKSRSRPKQTPFLVRVRYTGGPSIYFRFDPDAQNAKGQNANIRFLNPPGFGRRDSGFGPDVPGPVPGYGNQVVSDFWDDVGSPEFEAMWKRTESGPVWTSD